MSERLERVEVREFGGQFAALDQAQFQRRQNQLVKDFRWFSPDRYTVLIVESDLIEQSRLDELLRSSGIRTVCVNSAGQALQVMVRRHIDVVVCAQDLLDISGCEFTKQLGWLRRSPRKAGLAIILISPAEQEAAREAVASGADMVCLREKTGEMLIPQVMFLIR